MQYNRKVTEGARRSRPFLLLEDSHFRILNTTRYVEFTKMADDLLSEIIAELDPDQIPWRFIDTVYVTNSDGIQREISEPELSILMSHPSIDKMSMSVEVLFDEALIRKTIRTEIARVWSDVANYIEVSEEKNDNDE